MTYQKKLARSGLEDALRFLEQEKGVKITFLSSEQLKAFREQTSPVYQKYAQKVGWDLVRAFESAAMPLNEDSH